MATWSGRLPPYLARPWQLASLAPPSIESWCPREWLSETSMRSRTNRHRPRKSPVGPWRRRRLAGLPRPGWAQHFGNIRPMCPEVKPSGYPANRPTGRSTTARGPGRLACGFMAQAKGPHRFSPIIPTTVMQAPRTRVCGGVAGGHWTWLPQPGKQVAVLIVARVRSMMSSGRWQN